MQLKKNHELTDLGHDPPIYNGEDVQVVNTNRFLWQTQLIDIIQKKPNNRTILWIFDPFGNTGKSVFTKFLTLHYNAQPLGFGRQEDLFYARSLSMEKVFKRKK
jgi:hypothetical protein